jgi:hypothetical protein
MEVKKKCPTLIAWTERMQAHPLLKDVCAQKEYWHSHMVLQNANPPGVKYQLSIDYLKKD